MATAKLTIKQGQHAKDVVVSAGSAIVGSDALELNMDITDMTKGQVQVLLDELNQYIHKSEFIPN